MLRDTAESFLAAVSDSAAVRAAMVSSNGFDGELWQRLCDEMYLQGILVPESCDGLDLHGGDDNRLRAAGSSSDTFTALRLGIDFFQIFHHQNLKYLRRKLKSILETF